MDKDEPVERTIADCQQQASELADLLVAIEYHARQIQEHTTTVKGESEDGLNYEAHATTLGKLLAEVKRMSRELEADLLKLEPVE